MQENSRHEKAPALAGGGALGNVNLLRKNVMANNSTAVSNVIPFRHSKLLLVEQAGEPFVPMKPIVEGMGLDWKSQFTKLQGGRFKSVMVMITTTGSDGKSYQMSCLPLRKLAGWLMSIHASKVRHDLRDNVVAFQNECDDALWSYWNQGQAINQRSQSQSMTLIGQTIGTDGFHMLGSVVKGKVSSLPAHIQRRATSKIWSQVHVAFGVRSAADIPAEKLDAARNFVAAYAVHEGEYISKDDGIPSAGDQDSRYMVSWNARGERQVEVIPSGSYVLSQQEFMKGITSVPGDIMVSTDDMFDHVMAGMLSLKARYDFLARKKAG